MITAYGREEINRHTNGMNLDGVLLKPVSPSVLRDAIVDALARRESPFALEPRLFPATAERPLTRGRILLAEDNEINRLVAQEMIEGAGFQVEVAINGREAVEMTLAPGATFDLVLMDIQMPEMDGLEATARIRKAGKDLPILAMTAHALESERQRCLDAGMNDHIPKPFEPEALFAALARWIHPHEGSGDHGAAPPAGTLPPQPTQGIAPSRLLSRFKDDPGKMNHLLEILERDLLTHFAVIQEARREGDGPKAGRTAHSIKGLVGVIPLPGMREAALALEEALRNGAPWLDLALSLERALEVALGVLPARPSIYAPPVQEARSPDPEELGPRLGDLDQKLRRKSLSARKDAEALRALMGENPHMLRLEDCMNRMDFVGARKVLADLAKTLGLPPVSP